MAYLYLIRHGEAIKQVTRVVAGPRGDSGLTPRGIAQVERLRDRLRAMGEIPADVVISSPLARARQSAELLAPVWGLPITFDAELEELRKGVADGLSAEEAFARFGRPDFRGEPFRPYAPGGETWASFVLRAASALDRIAREHAGQHVVLVCHGGIVHAAFQTFLRLPTLAPAGTWFATANASITTWACEEGDSLAQPRYSSWRLLRHNDAAHIDGVTFPQTVPPPKRVTTESASSSRGPHPAKELNA